VGVESVSQISSSLTSAALRAMYRIMVRIREFEECIADGVLAGEIKTPCHLYIGQEAIATGVCANLFDSDTIWGGHRSHGHYIAKGGDISAAMAEIYGKVTGCSGGRGGSMHLVAPEHGILGTVPIVAATVPLAVGAALASKMQSSGNVAVAFFGDGTLEEGHVHESMNLAGVYNLPVVFVCENNLYASHMHLSERRVLDTVVDAGSFHGIRGVTVDGNDIEEVWRVAGEAVKRARTGKGPTFLECLTFRWRGHVGASWDEDVGVMRKDELKNWISKDPIARAANELLNRGVAPAEIERIKRDAKSEVASALEFAHNSPYPPAEGIADYVFV
jgi:TPP-dependent pyruvate/acetoin dehydrogenase alpha subunit